MRAAMIAECEQRAQGMSDVSFSPLFVLIDWYNATRTGN